MATLNMNDQMTALELARRANAPDPFNIIELLRTTNEFMIDAPAFECNNGIVNIATQRNIKAMGKHRIYNKGVGKVATQTTPIQDRIAMLAEYSEVDAEMIKHSGNENAARMSEATDIIKGMGLTQADTIVNGDGRKAEEFDGLLRRRNNIDDDNVVNAEGTGSETTSIYLCAFGRDLLHMIYPKGSKSVGITREDRGLVDVKDDEENEYPAYKDYFSAQYGITVKAPDALIRIVNIPIKTITAADLIDIIIDASYKLVKGATTYAMYSNVDVLKKIDKAARDKENVAYTAQDPWGKPITHIRDLRCRRMDAITSKESALV